MDFHLIWRLGMSWTMRTLIRNCNCDPVEPVTCVMDSPATWSKVKRVSGCPNQVMVWGPSCRRHLVTPFPAASVPVRGRVRIKTCHHQRLTCEAQAVFEETLGRISHMINLHNTLCRVSCQPARTYEVGRNVNTHLYVVVVPKIWILLELKFCFIWELICTIRHWGISNDLLRILLRRILCPSLARSRDRSGALSSRCCPRCTWSRLWITVSHPGWCMSGLNTTTTGTWWNAKVGAGRWWWRWSIWKYVVHVQCCISWIMLWRAVGHG